MSTEHQLDHDPGNPPVIQVENLTQRYGNGRLIYSGLSFDVPQGRILGLLGKNGTGKTTTINILMGFLKPQSGTCRIFGEDITKMNPATRRRIALLIEGHVQYQFMTIKQIERFYSKFYPGQWRADAYYELMSKLHVSDGQRISTMSCGQRSQVALGLILAQNADLLVLDDFSLGLDPGYRRLFIEYLRDYVKAEGKTVFMTSHIIQDLERLVDDCIILDYGKILIQEPVADFMRDFKCFRLRSTDTEGVISLKNDVSGLVRNPSWHRDGLELFTFGTEDEVKHLLDKSAIAYSDLHKVDMTLEDAFIGLTGKY